MKRFTLFIIFFVMFAATFVFTEVHPVAADSCTVLDITGPGSGVYAFTAGQTNNLSLTFNGVPVAGFPPTDTPNHTGSILIDLPAGFHYVVSRANCFGGPPIPMGFVLKTIGCKTALFDAPGGNPIAGTMIISGQTWFVNPVPVKDALGQSWTELFAGGYSDGFLWTSCVR